ncbi:hypothetical protein CPB84DRAFT_1767762 [Gymnopilus junonius]|uniref:Uncharacterized protein n=1 Tax=Gymnopilus junonius TaxID=109634 RepID=A0A9P5TS12_GYMJU|nr:hypothetical protein CPB84DRAFT_1767762 [Gymnopilus junonius]
MFKSLCGSGTFKNVVVLTTFWDQITEKKGSEREAELKRTSSALYALRVLAHIFTFTPSVVRIQEEIRVEGKSLENTEAGSLHREEVQRAIEEHNKQMAELREELDAVKQSNIVAKLQLELAQEKLQRNLDRWEHERSELKRGLEEERKAREQQGEMLAKKMEELRRGLDEGKARKRKESRPVMEVYVVEEKDAVKSRKVAKPAEKESGVEWERVSRSQQEIKPAKMGPVVEKNKVYERKEAEPTKEEWPCTLQ